MKSKKNLIGIGPTLIIFSCISIVALFLISIYSTQTLGNYLFKTAADSRIEKLNLFADLVQQDVINGFYPGVAEKCSKSIDRGLFVGISISLEINGHYICAFDTGQPSENIDYIEKKLLFDPNDETNSSVLATIKASYDRSIVESSVSDQKKFLLLGTLLVAICQIFLIFFLFHIISKPLSLLKSIFNKGDLQELEDSENTSILSEIYLFHETAKDLAKEIILKSNQLKEQSTYKAIAQTTQMLAHDVRKPFSMMEALIDIISDTSDPTAINATLQESIPAVSQAIVAVNGMIQDVMEVGSDPKIITSLIDAHSFIDKSLRQLFQYRDDLEVELDYRIPRGMTLEIDQIKFQRVLNNIISNAVEHMNNKGKIWFSISIPDISTGRSSFTIGNSDSFISHEDIPKLFDAFFTKEKAGGTGLGLAITKKIVEAHGGTIFCKSDQTKGTEFIFTVPAKIIDSENRVILPRTAAEFYKSPNDTSVNTKVKLTEDQKAMIEDLSLTIAIVDDETIYIDNFKNQINTISNDIEVLSYKNGEDLLQNLSKTEQPNIVVLDIDFSLQSVNGIDFCKALRREGYDGIICIHSNHGGLEYQRISIEAGANYFLPKPMSKIDILNIIESSIQKKTIRPIKQRILLFEDEPIFQRRWKTKAKPTEVTAVKSWSEFEENHPDLDFETISFVVMDLHLAHNESGIDAALNIRKIAPEIPIYLSTNADEMDTPPGLFNDVVGKDPGLALRRINSMPK
ncbi:MAG: hybrid sensor histidine kinase/response regulator [Pseudobacteriovorax sp.]|nr:hybrid sensor histidine kinase/response regulator [Pseudobacteriovorax sp.]